MADLFKGRYRVQSARCPKWDYRSNGAYFITICTKGRIHFFGGISSGLMHLSGAGEIVNNQWQLIPDHFPHIELDAFCLMPNHFHGILIIHDDSLKVSRITSEISTKIDIEFFSSISPKSGSLSTVIRSFKSSCTREINLQDPLIHFKWQPRFYDVIIRDDESYKRIRKYINNNPRKWKRDLFYRESNS